MVRQAHHERNQYVTVHPEPVEGLNQRFPKKQRNARVGIQLEEFIRIEMTAKEPGLEMRTRANCLDASFRQENEKAIDTYEDLLLDVLKDDRSLFLCFDEVEYAWRIVDLILQTWAIERDYIVTYPAGSWGPEDSRRLFDKESQSWRSSLTPECN